MAISKVILNGNTLMDVTQDTVTADKLLQTYTATKNDGTKVNGSYTPPTFSTQTKSVTPTESAQTVTPDSGYDGLSQVNVGAVSSTYVGTGVTRKSAQTYTPTTTDQTIASGQYLTGVQTIKGDANLLAENIKKGVVIFGITGTYEGDVPSGYTVTVSLTNPVNESGFSGCDICGALSNDVYDWGEQIGSISSATGSTSVSVDSSNYGIIVIVRGTSVSTDMSMCSCTGGVSAEDTDYSGAILFHVTGNGTITIDGVDYDD